MLVCMPRTSAPSAPVGPADLRALRASAGLTQRQLAGLAGCSPAWVMTAEGGYVPRRSPTLARVLDALDAALTHDGPAAAGEAAQDGEQTPDDRQA